MINYKEYNAINHLLLTKYKIRNNEFLEYDELILETCFPSNVTTQDEKMLAIAQLERIEKEIASRMVCEVALNNAITPQAVAFSERLQECRVDLDRLRGNDHTDNLALLCFALSHNLAWLSEKDAVAAEPIYYSEDDLKIDEDLPF